MPIVRLAAPVPHTDASAAATGHGGVPGHAAVEHGAEVDTASDGAAMAQADAPPPAPDACSPRA